MKQKMKWVAPKLIIMTRDSGTAVLIGCKSNSPPLTGPGHSNCMAHINCCEGPGCVVYPSVPSCTSRCTTGAGCPGGTFDTFGMQQACCSCAQYFQHTGLDCTVGGYCTCNTLNVS